MNCKFLKGLFEDNHWEETLTPWGKYITHFKPEDESVCFKTLYINHNQQISVQTHELRQEVWYISDVNASYELTLGDKTEVLSGKIRVDIPTRCVHSIKNFNKEPLVIYEMQLGICRESDIKRLSDIYGRIL